LQAEDHQVALSSTNSGSQSMSLNAPSSAHQRRPLPHGYRTGIIDAIAIFIGFSLMLLRFWTFEAPGDGAVANFS
jgi:hypothetical protein